MNETIFCKGGSQYITKLIDESVKNGTRMATVQGNWEVDEAIRIPGDFTLVLDGCHLRMADGCFSNLFVNEHHDTEIGKTLQGTDKNISIIGKNKAILDGGEFNGLSEKTQLTNGLPPIWKNHILFFTNVDGFKIENVSFHNQRYWALDFIYCRNGRISDIDFKGCDIWVDENGKHHHGLSLARYAEILVKTADGIDIRCGCHDIEIENITGFVEDDSVAINACGGDLVETFSVDGLSPDIYSITVKNVRTASLCNNVRLLNQGEAKMHDILIDGVYDSSAESPHMERGGCSVRIGDPHIYYARQSTYDDTYNITIKNVRSRALYAIGLAGGIGNLVLDNVECFDGAEQIYVTFKDRHG